MVSQTLSFDGIRIQILQQWRRGQVFPFQAFIMLQFSWFSRAAGFMKINAILPDCFLRFWCALMHYETIQGTEISLPLSSNQQGLICADSEDDFDSDIGLSNQVNKSEHLVCLRPLPPVILPIWWYQITLLGSITSTQQADFANVCSVEFAKHFLSFLFLIPGQGERNRWWAGNV